MLVTPMPGGSHSNLLQVLRELVATAQNTRGASGDPLERWEQYLRWASESAGRLRGQVRPGDVSRLILTPRYELLQNVSNRVVMDCLLRLEMDERVAALEEALRTIEHQIEHWSPLRNLGYFVVADTWVYIHADKLEELDLAAILGLGERPIHLLVPILVVDELDGLKQTKQVPGRWRSRYTLSVIDRVLPKPSEIGVLRPQYIGAHGAPRGGTTIELVLDPPGHVRLPIHDGTASSDPGPPVQSHASANALEGRRI